MTGRDDIQGRARMWEVVRGGGSAHVSDRSCKRWISGALDAVLARVSVRLDNVRAMLPLRRLAAVHDTKHRRGRTFAFWVFLLLTRRGRVRLGTAELGNMRWAGGAAREGELRECGQCWTAGTDIMHHQAQWAHAQGSRAPAKALACGLEVDDMSSATRGCVSRLKTRPKPLKQDPA